MSDHEEDQHDMGFLWANQSWGLSNSDNSAEGKEKLGLNPSKTSSSNVQKEEINEGEALYKKRCQGTCKSGKKISGEGKEDGQDVESDLEIHIWTERERRKKMRNMFSSLHALLPQLPSKADKSTIVEEAVNYIKNLQQTLQKLQKQKLERIQSVSTSGYELSMINSQWHPHDSREAFVADHVSSNSMANAMGASNVSNSFSVPQQHVAFQTWYSSNVVLTICGDEAHFSVCSLKKPGLMTTICFMLEKHNIEIISAQVLCNDHRSTYAIQAHANRASDQCPEANSVEETFKQAAGEIMQWLS